MMRLLIVDDHSAVRAMIRQISAPVVNEVRECSSGSEAVRVAREYKPDLITMDLRMPGIGGIDATRALRQACPSASVVIVTSYDEQPLRDAATTAGASHFIAKDNLAELEPLFARLAEASGSQHLPHGQGNL